MTSKLGPTLVIRFNSTFSWLSHQEIIPALERAWLASANGEHRVEVVDASRESIVSIVPRALAASRLVFPDFTLASGAVTALVRLLRESMGCATPCLFHLHGDASRAGETLEGLWPLLTLRDTFLVSSEAERRTLRLCFPRARVRVVPFPLVRRIPSASNGGRARTTASRPRRDMMFVYAGRISAQKNLHTLLLALWQLKRTQPQRRLRLEIYGPEDDLGSPNMGLKFKAYGRYLKQLITELGLSKEVHWKGFVPRAKLQKRLAGTPHVFVSSSLHADENFGAAALYSLAQGNTCVLSSWGGHRDFRKAFGDQVRLVKVHATELGPCLSPLELAWAMGQALSRSGAPARAAVLRGYTEAGVAPLLRNAALVRGGSRSALRQCELARALNARRAQTPLFSGYGDKRAVPFFKAYGMSRAKIKPRAARNGRVGLLVPWVKIARNGVTVRDPQRGIFRHAKDRLVWRWLAERGWLW